MARDFMWRDALSDAAQHYGIVLPLPELDDLNGEVTAVVGEWVRQNLVDARLLTTEEISLCNLFKGSKNELVASLEQRNSLQHPASELALQAAVQQLESETQTLQSKSHVIAEQIRHVQGSTIERSGPGQTDFQLIPNLKKREETEKQQLLFLNEEVMQQLQGSAQQVSKKLEKTSKAVSSGVSEKLKLDDRTLELLDISSRVGNIDPPTQRLQNQHMLDALQHAQVLSLKCRLDRHYLEELTAQKPWFSDGQEPSAIEQVRNDLHSLHIEIEDIAAMLIDHQYGKETRVLEARLKVLSDKAASQTMLNVITKLKHLTQSTEQLASRYRMLLVHQLTYKEIQMLHAQIRAPQSQGVISDDEKHLEDKVQGLENLLRHLGIDNGEDSETIPTVLRLLQSSKTRVGGVQSTVAHIVGTARRDATQSQEQLQGLLTISGNSLAQAMQQIRTFDHRVARTKAKLETSAKLVDLDVDGHGRSVGGSRHA